MSLTNKGHLFIHLGPPKTATTSLQKAFQELRHKQVFYGGIYHPRGTRQSIADMILHDIESGKQKYYDLVINNIHEALQSYDFLIISEEKFLINNKNSTWKQKIQEMYKYLDDFNPTIILTIRNPLDAIPSYYQQIYIGLPKRLRKNFSDFIKSDYCKIYHYEYLINYLNNIGFKKINLIDFNKLTDGNCTLQDFIGHGELKIDSPIIISHFNKSKQISKTRISQPTTLKRYFSIKISAIPKSRVFVGMGLSKILLDLIPNFMVSSGKELPIINKTDTNLKKFVEEYENILNPINVSGNYK
jgi:hypothetical protein